MKIDGDHEFENILFRIILISLTVASAFGRNHCVGWGQNFSPTQTVFPGPLPVKLPTEKNFRKFLLAQKLQYEI